MPRPKKSDANGVPQPKSRLPALQKSRRLGRGQGPRCSTGPTSLRHLEAAYRQAYRRWFEGKAPGPIEIG
jgi:hypothetical protein